jgi:hypothetical protein
MFHHLGKCVVSFALFADELLSDLASLNLVKDTFPRSQKRLAPLDTKGFSLLSNRSAVNPVYN